MRPEGGMVSKARLSPFLRIWLRRTCTCQDVTLSRLFPAVGSGGLGMDGHPLYHSGQSAVPSEAVSCGTRERAVSWDPRGSLSLVLSLLISSGRLI